MGKLRLQLGALDLNLDVDDLTINGDSVSATVRSGDRVGRITIQGDMQPKKITNAKGGPERQIQDAIIKYLRERGWVVRETHGNLYQNGFPDLYCAHKSYGARWIEVKNPDGFKFENSQLEFFPQLASVGVGVWVLTAATDAEYQKLFRHANWWQYLNVAQPHKSVRGVK